MKKITMVVVALSAMLASAGLVSAMWDGPGMGYGPGCSSGVKPETMKKFQKETFSLREEMMTKKLDVRAEYDKQEPDNARIAALRKEIIDIEAKIQVAADKYGIGSWGRGPGRGIMAGRGCNCWNGQ